MTLPGRLAVVVSGQVVAVGWHHGWVGRVNYGSSDVAHRYARGRALSEDVLDRWGTAVGRWAPPTDFKDRVLDLGAGAGIFARAWVSWRSCEVIALEPAPAMRSEMLSAGPPAGVRVVAGRGENLPLRSDSVRLAWLSAVIHHLSDLNSCGRELRRVLVEDGVVLIRGLFSNGAEPAGLRFLPGWERALSAFPSAEASAAMSACGFSVLGRSEVIDHGPSTVGETADWIRRLRHADTFLGRLTDEQIGEGLAVMGSMDPSDSLEPSTLTLLALAAQ